MQETRLNDYLKIIKSNDSINTIYNKLAKLEIEGKLNNKEYKSLIPIIENINKRTTNTINSYPKKDMDLALFVSNIYDINNISDFDFDYYVKELYYTDNIKIRRFIEFLDEITLDYDEITEEEIVISHGEGIFLHGIYYSWENAIELLEECDNEVLANHIRTLLEQDQEKTCNDLEINHYLTYITQCLQIHTFMQYLISAINYTKIDEIKEKLIIFKYKMISTFKCLEDYFVNDPKDFNKCTFFQEELQRFHVDQKEFFVNNDYLYQQDINNVLENYIEDKNEDNLNIDEVVLDILSTIYIQTYRSMITNFDEIYKVDEDIITAMDLSQNEYNKFILKNSLYLKPNLVLAKKLTNS